MFVFGGECELLLTMSSQVAKKSSRVDTKASKEDLKDTTMERGGARNHRVRPCTHGLKNYLRMCSVYLGCLVVSIASLHPAGPWPTSDSKHHSLKG